MNPVVNTEQLDKLISDSFLKNCLTNNYLLPASYHKAISENKIFFLRSNTNTIIIVEKGTFSQVFYYLNNLSEPFRFPFVKPAVMEILYRGSTGRPDNVVKYWASCDFKEHLTRDNLVTSGEQVKIPTVVNKDVICSFTGTKDEIIFTHGLLVNSLDNYTGNILSYEELCHYGAQGRIICAYWKSEIAGALQFDIRNNTAWLDHIAVAPEYRGKGVALELVRTFIMINSGNPDMKFSLWVRKDNTSAINLYSKFGFSYGNKSTVSLIKLSK